MNVAKSIAMISSPYGVCFLPYFINITQEGLFVKYFAVKQMSGVFCIIIS